MPRGRPSHQHTRKNLVIYCSDDDYRTIIDNTDTTERAEILLAHIGGNMKLSKLYPVGSQVTALHPHTNEPEPATVQNHATRRFGPGKHHEIALVVRFGDGTWGDVPEAFLREDGFGSVWESEIVS